MHIRKGVRFERLEMLMQKNSTLRGLESEIEVGGVKKVSIRGKGIFGMKHWEAKNEILG